MWENMVMVVCKDYYTYKWKNKNVKGTNNAPYVLQNLLLQNYKHVIL